MSKILIIAGEASGDLHGASLIKELKAISSDLEFVGIGGDLMKKEGMQLLFHINQMAFLGFVEVLKHLPFIKKVQKALIDFIENEKIKNVIFIDYPGFNLSMAKKIKTNVKKFYYISPQIWAWAKNRVFKVKKYIDHMLVFFPFEEKFYSSYGVSVNYVGHPLVDEVANHTFLTKDELFSRFSLLKKEILLIMPGSRKQEIKEILPDILPAAKSLSDKYNLQIVVACSNNIELNIFDEFKLEYKFHLIKGFTYDLLKYSKFGIIKSGTSTLEAGLLQLPFIIVYKTKWLTYQIGKLLIKIKNIGLVNIVAEKNIVQELIQDEVNYENINKIVSSYLDDESKLSSIKNELAIINYKLGESGAAKKTAKLIFDGLNEI